MAAAVEAGEQKAETDKAPSMVTGERKVDIEKPTSMGTGEKKADTDNAPTMETWDPMEEAFCDPRFNVYTSGPGANLDSALQPYNRSTSGKERIYRLYITGLPQGLTKRGLTNIFCNFGFPFDVAIVSTAGTGFKYAFVSYRTEKEAEKAIRELNSKPPLHLRVDFARSDEEKARLLKENAEAELLCKIMSDMRPYEGPSYTPKFPNRMNITMPGMHDKRADYLADNVWFETAVPHASGFYCPYTGNQSSNSSRVVLRYLTFNNELKTDRVVFLGRGYFRPSACPVELPGRSRKFTKLDGREDVWTCGREVPLRMGKCVRCSMETPHHCKRCSTWYCSRDCQLVDWPQHKEHCSHQSTSNTPSVINESTAKVAPRSGRGRSKLSSNLLRRLADMDGGPDSWRVPVQPVSELETLMQPSRDDQFLPVCELSITIRLSQGMTGTGKMHRKFGEEFTAKLDCRPEDAETISHFHEDLMQENSSSTFQPREGDLVAVLSATTGRWSRGHVLELLNSGYVVALCDVGSVEIVTEVKQLPDKYRHLLEHIVTLNARSQHTFIFKEDAAFSYAVVNHEGSEATCTFTYVDSGETYRISMLPWQPLPEDAGLKTVMVGDGDPVIISSLFDQENLYLRPASKQHLLQFHIVSSATAAYATLHGQELGPKGPRVGEMVACQFSGDGIFYRALVVGVDGGSYTVAYVDFGNQEAVSVDKLRALNSSLKQHPCFAVKVSLSDVPKNILTSAAAKHLMKLIKEETILQLELQGPIADGVKLYCDKTCVNETIKELLQQQWRKELSSNVPPAGCCASMLKYVTLPVGETVSLVILSVLDDGEEPGGLTVTGCRADEEVIPYVYRSLLREINLYAYHSKAKMFVPHVGDVCIAKNSDDIWHRALCIELKRNEVVVMLVDVGTMIRIPYYHVRSIPAEFTEGPALGLLCRFQGVEDDLRKLLTPRSIHTVQVVSHVDDVYLVSLVEATKP